MGYNGNNRGYSRRRNGHRGAYRSGEHIIGSVFKGLLGLGAITAREITKSTDNTPPLQEDNKQDGLGCLIPVALILIPLNLLGLRLSGLPIVGIAIEAVLVMLLYGVFSGCALSVKKMPLYGKVIFWLTLIVFCLACSYWILDVDNVLPYRAIDQIDNQVHWYIPLDTNIWLVGGVFPYAACYIGYLSGIYKAKKENKVANTK